MKKAEFLQKLQEEISVYPYEETKKSLEYYEEMIDDRMEDGMTEDEAVASLGRVEDIVDQIKCELPITTIVKQKAMEKTNGGKIPGYVIALLIIGCPLWLPILISIFASIFSIYVSIWSVAVVLWAIDFIFAAVSVVGLVGSVVMFVKGSFVSALIYLGAAILLAGLAIFFFMASYFVSKGIVYGTGWLFKQIKKAIIGNKEA